MKLIAISPGDHSVGILPDVTNEIEHGSIFLGDITRIYDICGRLSLCPDCESAGHREGCGRRYVAGTVYSEPDEGVP